MSNFEQLIKEAAEILLEQDPNTPPMDMGGGEPPMDMGGGEGSALPGMGGEGGAPPEEDMGNEVKKEADPIAYTEETLGMLVDPEEGVSPEMFSDWIDTFGVGAVKIKDKEGFKRFYSNLYERLQLVLDVKDELKQTFQQLHGTLKDVISTQRQEPNTAGGGTGMAGPAGPGVD